MFGSLLILSQFGPGGREAGLVGKYFPFPFASSQLCGAYTYTTLFPAVYSVHSSDIRALLGQLREKNLGRRPTLRLQQLYSSPNLIVTTRLPTKRARTYSPLAWPGMYMLVELLNY